MWQKIYRIAERQISAGKFKKAEAQLKKALALAEAAGDKTLVAKTLSLTAILYLESERGDAPAALRRSVQAAELAYGPESQELSEELALLAMTLGTVEKVEDENLEKKNLEEAESSWLRAIAIEESREESDEKSERLLDFLYNLLDLHMHREAFESAEPVVRKIVELKKKVYGASSFEVEEEIGTYQKILTGLGREAEAENIEKSVHSCPNSDAEGSHYPDEMEAALERLRAALPKLSEQEKIRRFEEALTELEEIHDRLCRTIDSRALFKEVQMRVLSTPVREVRSSLARLLRLQALDAEVVASMEHTDLLRKAISLLEKNIEEAALFYDMRYRVLTLLDLTNYDESRYPELEEALDRLPNCAEKLYSKAIMLFRREGSTSRSRAAIREALLFNPHVPVVLANGCDPDENPSQFMLGDRNEAHLYCQEAIYQWEATPGFIRFVSDAAGKIMNSVECGVSLTQERKKLTASAH